MSEPGQYTSAVNANNGETPETGGLTPGNGPETPTRDAGEALEAADDAAGTPGPGPEASDVDELPDLPGDPGDVVVEEVDVEVTDDDVDDDTENPGPAAGSY